MDALVNCLNGPHSLIYLFVHFHQTLTSLKIILDLQALGLFDL